MDEALEETIKELKRVEHLFYVSLKYTRTVDMIKHMVQRIINLYQYGIQALLNHLLEQKKIQSIPTNIAMQARTVQEMYPEELSHHINFYLKLRRVIRAEHAKREEYRRHVTMIATINNGEIVEVSIDSLKEAYEETIKFVKFLRQVILGEEEY